MTTKKASYTSIQASKITTLQDKVFKMKGEFNAMKKENRDIRLSNAKLHEYNQELRKDYGILERELKETESTLEEVRQLLWTSGKWLLIMCITSLSLISYLLYLYFDYKGTL
jgi:predicted nuclease with TOPRIM domain